MTVRVVRPGMLTTVQDRGRWGHQRHGVPPGGAMDEWALRLANLLVGNSESDAALEMTLAGPQLVFERETTLALAGADFSATLDEKPLPGWRATVAHPGETLSLGRPAVGCRAYLAIAGGIAVPPALGSRATYARAKLGGIEGRSLAAGDLLPLGRASPANDRVRRSLGSARSAAWSIAASLRPAYSSDPRVRLIAGAHLGLLTKPARERLFNERFRVAQQSDRMGYRLEGPPLELDAPLEVLSEAVVFGTIQLPPGGQLIALMADRQTTGGYPRVGEVATVDLPLLAQLRPGDTVRFSEVTVAEAQRLYLAREAELEHYKAGVALL